MKYNGSKTEHEKSFFTEGFRKKQNSPQGYSIWMKSLRSNNCFLLLCSVSCTCISMFFPNAFHWFCAAKIFQSRYLEILKNDRFSKIRQDTSLCLFWKSIQRKKALCLLGSREKTFFFGNPDGTEPFFIRFAVQALDLYSLPVWMESNLRSGSAQYSVTQVQ